MSQTIALVGGAQRSGTTALQRLLSLHPDVAILRERYTGRAAKGEFGPELFAADRVATFVPGDCKRDTLDKPGTQRILRKFRDAKVVGDKIPRIDLLLRAARTIPGCKVVAVLREPYGMAQSYQRRFENPDDGFSSDFRRAVREFNDLVGELDAIDPENENFDLCVVSHWDLLSDPARLGYVFDFLGVDRPDPAIYGKSRLSGDDRRRVDADVANHVVSHARIRTFRQVIARFGLAQPVPDGGAWR